MTDSALTPANRALVERVLGHGNFDAEGKWLIDDVHVSWIPALLDAAMAEGRAEPENLLREAKIVLSRIAHGGQGSEGRFLTAHEARNVAHPVEYKIWLYFKAAPSPTQQETKP
jgi:hypothetical protein